MFLELLIILLSVFLMMLPGYISAANGIIGEESLREISALHVNFLYPCLILYSLTSSFDAVELCALWFLPLSCFGIMLIGYLIAFLFKGLSIFSGEEERKAFQFQCTMNNYSFIPLPIAMSLYGEKGAAVVIYSLIGAEIALWTLGIISLKGFTLDKNALKKFFAPALLALYFSITLIMISGYFSFNLKGLLSSDTFLAKIALPIKTVASAVIPLAMVVSGARMALMPLKEMNKYSVWLTSILRLIVIPVIAIFAISLLPIDELYRNVLFIIAAMPVAMASIPISEIYGGDKDFVTATVVLTHVLSLITVPILISFAHIIVRLS